MSDASKNAREYVQREDARALDLVMCCDASTCPRTTLDGGVALTRHECGRPEPANALAALDTKEPTT